MARIITSIFNLPVFVLLVGNILFFVSISLLMLYFVQKYFIWMKWEKGSQFSETFSDAIGLAFGLVLAFVTVGTWQSYNNVADTITKEANTLMNVYRTLEAYPPEIREKGKSQLKDYVNEIIANEWPSMAHHQYDTSAYLKFTDFTDLILYYQPRNYAELAAQQEELRLISEYRDFRRNRIENAKSLLDGHMLLTLILSALLYILYQCLYQMDSLRMHFIMISILATSISLTFFLLVLYSNPFIGPSAIEPQAFERLLSFYWLPSH